MDAVRQLIIEEARLYLGVPFLHLGRTTGGLDCVGLLVVVFDAIVGVEEDPTGYPKQPRSAAVFRQIRNYAKRIDVSDALPGDVVLIHRYGTSTHFGILTDRGVIHADMIAGRVVEHPIATADSKWRIAAYYRVNGVAERCEEVA